MGSYHSFHIPSTCQNRDWIRKRIAGRVGIVIDIQARRETGIHMHGGGRFLHHDLAVYHVERRYNTSRLSNSNNLVGIVIRRSVVGRDGVCLGIQRSVIRQIERDRGSSSGTAA